MSATEAAVKLVEDALTEKQTELDKLTGPLGVEVSELKTLLKKMTRGTGKKAGDAPATSDEDLLAAVKHASKAGPAKSPDVAKVLDVDPRTISRRLSAWAAEGKLQGNKESGYTV